MIGPAPRRRINRCIIATYIILRVFYWNIYHFSNSYETTSRYPSGVSFIFSKVRTFLTSLLAFFMFVCANRRFFMQ